MPTYISDFLRDRLRVRADRVIPDEPEDARPALVLGMVLTGLPLPHCRAPNADPRGGFSSGEAEGLAAVPEMGGEARARRRDEG